MTVKNISSMGKGNYQFWSKEYFQKRKYLIYCSKKEKEIAKIE